MELHLSFPLGQSLSYDDGIVAFIKKIRDITGDKGGN